MMPRPINMLVYLLSLGITSYSFAENNNKHVKIIEPDKTVTSIQAAAIDTEKFELGPYVGLLSVEDFNSNFVSGIAFTYHINKKFITQINYGLSTVKKAAFEEVAAGNFLAKKDYDFEYVNLLGGYDLLDGRSFLGKNHKFNSAIYLLVGAAEVSFAGEKNTGLVAGVSYRAVITDWITINLDLRDTRVSRNFLNDEKTTKNTEKLLGLNVLN
jgi:outer membrane beta-barrel protein